jgi:heme A synthase
VALRRRARDPAARERFLPFLIAPALLALQNLLGAMNVWLGKHPALIVAHLTLATLLWATVVHAGASLLAVPVPAGRRAEGPGATQASDRRRR